MTAKSMPCALAQYERADSKVLGVVSTIHPRGLHPAPEPASVGGGGGGLGGSVLTAERVWHVYDPSLRLIVK